MAMVIFDESALRDPVRLAAVARARRDMPRLTLPLDAIATMAARLLDAPMGIVTLVGADEEYLAGAHEMPGPLTAERRALIAYSVCKFAVGAGRPVRSSDLLAEDDPSMCEHLLGSEYGVRAFLGVPVHDADDNVIGSLTVLDRAVRNWSDDQVTTMVAIADVLRSVARDHAKAPSSVATIDSASLLDSVQEAFLAVDAAGVVVGWNRAAQDLLGYAAAEVCGRHLDDSVLPDYDGQPIGAALTRLFSAAPRHRVVRRVDVRHRDGHRLAAEAALSVVTSANGPLACVFLTDRSGQAAAEDAAEHSDGFRTALLDSLSVGVVACDHNGRVVLVNRALRDIQQLPAAGPIPPRYAVMSETGLRHADMTPMRWQQTPLMRAFRGEQVPATEVVVRADGAPLRTFDVTAQPIRGADNRLLGAVAAAHDVTAVRRVERFRSCHLGVAQALAAAGSVAEAAVGVLQTVATTLRWPHAELWLIDEATDTIERTGYWSAPGYRAHDIGGHVVVKGAGIIGRVWQTGEPLWVPDIGAPDLFTGLAQAQARACLQHGIRTVLAVPVRAGGTMLGVLNCCAGAPEYHEDLLTVLLDGVAAQIGMFVALRRAENLTRQLARSRDDFIALADHQLRTPLTAVTANVALLGEEPDRLNDDQRAMVAAIERNTTQLRDTVDTLLDLAGLDSGQVGLSVARVDLAALSTEAVATAGTAAAAHGVRIRTDLSRDVLIDGDPDRLQQVVGDLLSHAVNDSPDGGQVTVRLSGNGNGAELTVTDEGDGTARHPGAAGSGLGLRRVRTILRLHGGTITLTDRHPSGTTARVRLPYPAEDAVQGRST